MGTSKSVEKRDDTGDKGGKDTEEGKKGKEGAKRKRKYIRQETNQEDRNEQEKCRSKEV